MMRLKLVRIAAVLILCGCWTPDDVKKTGTVWSGTYAARYDQSGKVPVGADDAVLQGNASARHK
jgi:hypothetical protein